MMCYVSCDGRGRFPAQEVSPGLWRIERPNGTVYYCNIFLDENHKWEIVK